VRRSSVLTPETLETLGAPEVDHHHHQAAVGQLYGASERARDDTSDSTASRRARSCVYARHTRGLNGGNAIGDLSVRGLGQMRAAVRLLVERVDGLEVERGLACGALEADLVPVRVDGLDGLVRVHGLGAALALLRLGVVGHEAHGGRWNVM